jgi:16S rRNA processing protein RimM
VPADRVLLGVLGRPHGVRGLMHVLSHTDPPAALAEYGVLETADGASPWLGAAPASPR